MSGTPGSTTTTTVEVTPSMLQTGPELGILGKLGGRKFLMAIAGVLAVALHKYIPWVDPNDVLAIAAIVATYIVGQSYSDAKTGGATSTTTPVTDPVEVSRIDQATEIIRQDTAKMEAGQAIVQAAVEHSGPGALRDPKIADIVESLK